MSKMANSTELVDARDRRTAVTTFDRNLIVTAGAGTGKTTLLIDRLVHLLVRSPEPLKITEIVALTFTNKAAEEMRVRLRQRMQAYLTVQLDELIDANEQTTEREIEGLMADYQLSKGELDSRLREALKNLERSDIGTIHSFAANLLRLYPLEAGVDPQFREDEGPDFEQLFEDFWDQWLGQQLSLQSAQAEEWEKVLSACTLEEIRALAKSLAAENVDLRENPQSSGPIPLVLANWLRDLEERAAALMSRHPGERLNEKLVRAAGAVIGQFRNSGPALDRGSEECVLLSEKAINRSTLGWSPQDAQAAQDLVRAAKGLLRVNGDLIARLWRLLVPYALKFREKFVREGHLSFDALLVRARDMLRDNKRVRADLKQRYRAILIDEFQDTDPIQYEILLYLAEAPGRSATDWRQVKVAPGKIFVVGDPKQSIYAFRRADIEAYLEVIERIIRVQDGVECQLTTNFRSNETILQGVNGAFETIMRPQDGLQPPYIGIHPAPGRTAADSRVPKLLIRKLVSDRDLNAETARHLEGQSLARWLREDILGKLAIRNTRGENVLARAKDVAILLRKLTDIHDYLEPLRREGIRYVVEGERHFYAAKEIIDAVSLLRAVGNPYDRLALVGVLRSPLGALTDQQIYDLHRQHLLDYRAADQLGKDFPESLPRLYEALFGLHQEVAALPVGEAVSHIFATLPVEILAAASFHGEQALANLQKLTRQAEVLGSRGLTTFRGAIRELEKRILEIKDEGESALAEESLDAVRVMSIHKAKGLEFPMVILAGCNAGIESGRGSEAEAMFDWSSGLTGVRIGSVSDLAGLYITEKSRRRGLEEQKRLLYVAMTRAREHLTISCAPSSRRAGGSFCAMLDGALGGAIGAATSDQEAALGQGRVAIGVVRGTLAAPSRERPVPSPRKRRNWQPYLDRWSRRTNLYESAESSAIFVAPSGLKPKERGITEAGDAPPPKPPLLPALVIGDLAHRFLQRWDFTEGIERLESTLHQWLAQALPPEFENDSGKFETALREIFSGFLDSPAWTELAGARILGREVPLLMPWDGRIMEGVIDLIYERDGLLYLADYKTDNLAATEVKDGAERYRLQAEIYCRAVTQALRREPVSFKIIFLRLGQAVELRVGEKQQLSLF